MESQQDGQQTEEKYPYVEILGDTVTPTHTIAAVVISVGLGLGGYLLGEKILPGIASAEMVQSYSLLAGIVGCVIALILCAVLFKPKKGFNRDRDQAGRSR
ncbi:hypothetical protein RWE15_05365 [Virgibacillus halophilus]|uniref:Uncharacterized protein n=1 Tax=Tigheibacillus halophilus TaxID=361280 RepID=A0ABU5C489_9BACI|nr:hypothetical protein [Virgibacillus halophilus]